MADDTDTDTKEDTKDDPTDVTPAAGEFTQAQVNAIAAEERRRGQEKNAELEKTLDESRKKADELEAAVLKYEEEKKDYSGKLEVAEGKALRLQVALDKGLPAPIAERLVGDTAEEMAKDADRLSELLKKPDPKLGGGPREDPPADDDINAKIRRAAGRGA